LAEKLRVLHVDDDVIMGMQIKELLEGEGYEVSDTVSSGAEAIESVRSNRPGIVLMDVRLKGGMNGIETAAKIRSFSDVPVIFLTGYKNTSTLESARGLANTVFVSKPFEVVKLFEAIEQFRIK